MNIITGAILGVASRHLYQWFSDKANRNKVLYDISSISSIENTLIVSVIVLNNSDTTTAISCQNLQTFRNNKRLATTPVNNNTFRLEPGQAINFNHIQFNVENIDNLNDFNFTLIAKIDKVTMSLKPIERNGFGGVFNPNRLSHYKTLDE